MYRKLEAAGSRLLGLFVPSVEAGACEVGLLPGRRGCVVLEFLVDEINHERGVDERVRARARTRTGRCGRGRARRR